MHYNEGRSFYCKKFLPAESNEAAGNGEQEEKVQKEFLTKREGEKERKEDFSSEKYEIKNLLILSKKSVVAGY